MEQEMPIREQPTIPEHNAADARIQQAAAEKQRQAAAASKPATPKK